ncbi:hypothetical protein CHLNCDRAFT_144706 [Chlorella variabilis]|uniref:Uncharacterized protein n=1 Tax=Chlorella variabilis TaxID=554065 RepID=E1ZCU8_CHLVA|nr:hypothetical protein CHLNCDRAFT_144706 [Chlorella variabilis]EFN56108.1 hypothetical protein CHLNCDRAFT_144706 [Chlorella variabilis]|eukprot:XP_005848210.1 hypothetical protein CHLNCDRAFT_144706 [Chlorella variabilis]
MLRWRRFGPEEAEAQGDAAQAHYKGMQECSPAAVLLLDEKGRFLQHLLMAGLLEACEAITAQQQLERRHKWLQIKHKLPASPRKVSAMSEGPSVRTFALFVVSFFCPPMAVLISRGEIDSYFWVNLLLTLVGWLPGVAHAVWVLCSRNPLAQEEMWAGYAALTRPNGYV